MSRKESILMFISILSSIFAAIFLFQLLTWWKFHIFFTKDDIYFSSGEYSFVFMIIFIILFILFCFAFFIRHDNMYALMSFILLMLVSFTCLTNYTVITNKGWDSYLFFIRTDKVSWKEIDKIQTDYQMNTTRGTFSPVFAVTTVNDKEPIDLGKWGNIITSKPKLWDFTASGWISGDNETILRLREVKMMEFVYQHASEKLHCVQHGFEKPKKQLDVWKVFAENFVEPEKCEFQYE